MDRVAQWRQKAAGAAKGCRAHCVHSPHRILYRPNSSQARAGNIIQPIRLQSCLHIHSLPLAHLGRGGWGERAAVRDLDRGPNHNDTEHALATFGVTLRHKVDLDRLAALLASVGEETTQLDHVSCWQFETEPLFSRL